MRILWIIVIAAVLGALAAYGVSHLLHIGEYAVPLSGGTGGLAGGMIGQLAGKKKKKRA